MLAHPLLLEIQFTFLCNSNSRFHQFASNASSSSSQHPSTCTKYKLRSSAIRVHHPAAPAPAREDDSRTPQFEFIMPAYRFLREIEFEFLCKLAIQVLRSRTSSPASYASRFPPIQTFLLRTVVSAPARARDTIRNSNFSSSLAHRDTLRVSPNSNS